jgi:hypothetical protein
MPNVAFLLLQSLDVGAGDPSAFLEADMLETFNFQVLLSHLQIYLTLARTGIVQNSMSNIALYPV